MELALRALGVADRKERVGRYIANLLQQDEDVDTRPALQQIEVAVASRIHDSLDRANVLESRRNAKRANSTLQPASSWKPQSSAMQSSIPRRRRATDENARRAERTLGRAAHLRPGRITLLPPSAVHVNKSPEINAVNAVTPPPHDSWNKDDHSDYSNQIHDDGFALKRADQSQPSKRNPTSRIFQDFYQLNPCCLANGWLAERHHRDVLAETQQSVVPLESLSSAPLLGLCPPARKRSRKDQNTRSLARTHI